VAIRGRDDLHIVSRNQAGGWRRGKRGSHDRRREVTTGEERSQQGRRGHNRGGEVTTGEVRSQ